MCTLERLELLQYDFRAES